MAHNSIFLEGEAFPSAFPEAVVGKSRGAAALDSDRDSPGPRLVQPEETPRPATEPLTRFRYFSGNVHRIAALAVVEAAASLAAFFTAAGLLSGARVPPGAALGPGPAWPQALLLLSVLLVALSSMGLYRLRHRAPLASVLARLLVATGGAAILLEALFALSPSLGMGAGVATVAGLLSFLGLATTRFAFMRLVDQDVFKRRVLVWGAGERAATIGVRLRRRTDQRGFRVLGYVNTDADPEAVRVPRQKVIGTEADLLDFVMRERVHEIVVAMDDRRRGFPSTFLRECRLRGVIVRDIESFLERETGRVSVELARPSFLIYSSGFRSDFVRNAVKRAFDLGAALVLLAASLPVMLLAALAVKLEDGGPIFYRQVRTGRGGRPFRIIKFRSMSVNAEAGGKAVWAVRNDSRVTRVGAFIRKVRIDELPQVFNVLSGEMSFVGPRPERPEFVRTLARAIPFYDERHFVKPGITGWAQVRYPYGASEDDSREKLGYDLYYVMNHSLVFDIMVMLQTVEIVLFRIGSR